MRPLSLTISAFGPYASEVTIPFENLGKEGIYLICGDTGAGKTSIFDALMFALYGEATGTNRSIKSLRSDFADQKTPSFVELDFQVHNKHYHIKRSPSYIRPKQRGEGFIEQEAKAELTLPDGSVITKVRSVNEKIEEILGIDANQFSHIVMIAQGEFRKLLSSDTKTRASLMRKLFNTEQLETFQNILKEQRNAIKRDYKLADNNFQQLALQINFEENHPDKLRIKEYLDNNTMPIQELKDVILNQLKLEEEHITSYEASKKALNQTHEKLIKEKTQLSQRKEASKQLEEIAIFCQETNEKLSQAKEEQTKLLAKKEDIEAIKNKATLLEAKLPIYTQLQHAQKEKQLLETQEKSLQEIYNEYEASYIHTEKNIALLKQTIQSNEDIPVKLEQINQQTKNLNEEKKSIEDHIKQARYIETLSEKLNSLTTTYEKTLAEEKTDQSNQEELSKQHQALSEDLSQESDIAVLIESNKNACEKIALEEATLLKTQAEERKLAQDCINLENSLKQAQDTYRKERENLNEITSRYKLMHQQYLDEQAGLLAQELVDHLPCPVCGALDHPKPAQLSSKAPNKEDIEALDAKRQNIQAQTERSSQICKDKCEDLENKTCEYRNFIHEYSDKHAIEEKLLENKQARISLEEEKVELQKRLDKKIEIEQQLETVHTKLETIKQKLNEKAENLKQQEIELEKTKTEYQQLKKHVVEELPELKAALQTCCESLDSTMQQAKQLEVRNKELIKNKQDLITAEDSLKQVQIEKETSFNNLQHCKNQQDIYKSKIADLRKNLAQTSEQEALEELTNYKNTIKNFEEKLQEVTNATQAEKENLKAYLAKKESFEADVKKLAYLDEEKIEEAWTHNTSDLNEVQMHIDEEKAFYAHNSQLKKSFDTLVEKNEELEHAYRSIDLLARTATGDLRDRERVSFETYVQAIYFDQILVRANERLNFMTQGRYQLFRRMQAQSKQATTGLDIDVLDNYTGKKRDAQSLSGGESFKASLALALGLSDVVQAYAGGIQLDTMFIDEGFGSLDQQSLNLAIKALTEMNGGNKLIGIISHVEELKDAIDNKITVNRGRKGSTLSFSN